MPATSRTLARCLPLQGYYVTSSDGKSPYPNICVWNP